MYCRSRYEASLQKMRTRFLERVLINPDKIHLKADQILGSGSFGSKQLQLISQVILFIKAFLWAVGVE